MKKVINTKTNKYIDHVNGSMTIEGMPLTAEDKEILRRCLDGESTFDEERNKLKKEVASYIKSIKDYILQI